MLHAYRRSGERVRRDFPLRDLQGGAREVPLLFSRTDTKQALPSVPVPVIEGFMRVRLQLHASCLGACASVYEMGE